MNNWYLCWRTRLQETGKNPSLPKDLRHPSNWSTACAVNCGLWLQLWSLHEIYSPWICPCCVPSLNKATYFVPSMSLQNVLHIRPGDIWRLLHSLINSCSLPTAWPLVGKLFLVSSPFLELNVVLSRCSATVVTSSLGINKKSNKCRMLLK